MASLYKTTTVRYLDAEGRRVKKGTPGARKVTEKSKKWYGSHRDADGIIRRTALAANKTAAQTMLTELVRHAEQSKAGLSNEFEEHHKRPLARHVDDFETHLRSKDNSDVHVSLSVSRVRAIIDGCKFTYIRDVQASRIAEYLADRRASSTENLGPTTSNHYLRAIKQFTRWLVRDRRTDINALTHLDPVRTDNDIRRQRRALSSPDFERLVTAARESETVVCGLSGPERAMLYLTAAYTGLRASELASLSPRSLLMDGDPQTVTVEAAYSKHRRRDELPLHRDLAVELCEWLKERDQAADGSTIALSIGDTPAGEPVKLWPGRWAADRHGATMVKADLETAGLDYVDEDGRTFDFHSLRHQFITSLARNGVHPKSAQELARHSDINLTMGYYTHLGLRDMDSAMQQLPSMPKRDRGTGRVAG